MADPAVDDPLADIAGPMTPAQQQKAASYGAQRGQAQQADPLADLVGPMTPAQQNKAQQYKPPAAPAGPNFDWIQQPVMAAIKNAPSGFLQLPDLAMNTAAQRLPQGNLAQRYLQDVNTQLGRPANAPSNLSGWAQQAIPGAQQAAQKYPIAAQVGQYGAQALAAAFTPEAFGAGIANPWLKGAVQGAQYGAAGGAASELGEEEKQNAPINPGAIAQSAGVGGVTGGIFGGPFQVGANLIRRAFIPKVKPPYSAHDITATPPHRLLGTSRNYAVVPYEGHVDAEIVSPKQRAYESMAKQHGQPRTHQEQPKLIGRQPLVPPSARQRVEERQIVPPSPRMRAEAAHAEYIRRSQENAFGVPPQPPEPVTPVTPVTQPPKLLKGRVTKETKETKETKKAPEPEKPNTWRNLRNVQAQENAPEATGLTSFAKATRLKSQRHELVASAVRQLMEKEGITPPIRRRYISNEQYEQTIRPWLEKHGVSVNLGAEFIEGALAEHPKAEYQFKSLGLRGQLAELKRLVQQAKRADKIYDKTKTTAETALTEKKTVAVHVKGQQVNITRRAKVLPKTEKHFRSGADFAAYKKLQARELEAAPTFPDLTPEALARGVIDDPILKAKLEEFGALDWLKQFLKEEKGAGPGSGPFDLAKDSWDAASKAGMTIGLSARETLAKTAAHLKAAGIEKELTPRIFQRAFLNELTSDAIRRYNPEFAWKRDAYLAAIEKSMALVQKEPSREEHQAIKRLSPDEIRAPLLGEISQLKGWSPEQRAALASAKVLSDGYRQMVKKELQRVTEMLEPVKGGHTLFGWGRYKRMLDHDLEDLGGKQSGGNDSDSFWGGLLNKFTTMEYVSIFLGNYRVGVLHAGEAAMAFLSGHPVDTARALRTIITDATARKYAFLLAGRGMQASLGDGEKFAAAKWIDAHLNDPLLAKLEGLPNGKLIHQTLSAELPERLKTGASAVIAAEHVANDLHYPGGAQQLMADYLETASGGKIPTDRETALARAEVEVFRLRNRLIMHMPSATPISERTVFQRHRVGQLYFKMFRSVVQQARILSGYLDDASEAIVQKNPVKLGQALGSLAYAHVIVATLSGTATLPPYIWAALDKTNKPTADLLRHLFNETRKHNALGGRELEEFGVKYVPAWAGINSFAPELGRQLVRNVTKGFGGDTDSQLKAAIVLTSGVLCDNIAHTEGLQNLQYLYNRINEGMKGEARVRFFLKPDLLKSVLGAHSQKIYDEMHKTDIPRGIWQFLLGGESANRAALHHQAEREYEEEHAE